MLYGPCYALLHGGQVLKSGAHRATSPLECVPHLGHVELLHHRRAPDGPSLDTILSRGLGPPVPRFHVKDGGHQCVRQPTDEDNVQAHTEALSNLRGVSAHTMAQKPITMTSSDKVILPGEEFQINIKVFANKYMALEHNWAFDKFTATLTAFNFSMRFK